MIPSWQTVPARTPLGDCLHVFPQDDEDPVHLDIATDNETLKTRAAAAFVAFPKHAPCALFGGLILLQNPEYGSLEKRARHVSHYRDRKTGQYLVDPDKCRWLPSVPTTLLHAAAVFDDRAEGTVIFARYYDGHGLHFVVVKPLRSGFQRDQLSGYFITQFSHQKDGRQEAFRLHWKRPK